MDSLSPTYRKLPGSKFTSSKRVDYLTRLVAILHAFLVTFIAFHASFFSCDSNLTIFQDDLCRLEPKNYHALSALLTIGYLLFDLLATSLFNHQSNLLTYQTYAHHIAGITAFYFSLIVKPFGSPYLMGALANQFTEISTPFMNIRQLLYVHSMNDSVIATLNTVMFAVTFFIGRLLF